MQVLFDVVGSFVFAAAVHKKGLSFVFSCLPAAEVAACVEGGSSSSTVFLVPIVYLLSCSPVVCEAQVVAAGSVQFDDHTLLNMKMKNKS